jgi:hypothetical protein
VRALFLLALALLAAAAARAGVRPAPDGLAHALAARALLGPDLWARVLRIDNPGAGGCLRRWVYPRTVYAVVFELSGILWFYCDADGTQSLSLRTDTLEADKADPGPLLRAISPRFGAWAWVDPSGWAAPSGVSPPNACFIDCVAALRKRVAFGAEAAAPLLLSYYADTPSGRRGHTVLLFGAAGAEEALDPARSPEPVRLPSELGGDPRAISRYLRGGAVAAARELPLRLPPAPGAGWRCAELPPRLAHAG